MSEQVNATNMYLNARVVWLQFIKYFAQAGETVSTGQTPSIASKRSLIKWCLVHGVIHVCMHVFAHTRMRANMYMRMCLSSDMQL